MTTSAHVDRFFDFDEICRAADCVEIAKEIGLAVADNRCAATWRGGDNATSVSLSKEGWHDFSAGESGSVIDLVARVKFGGDKQQAQQWLGDRLVLTPSMVKGVEKTNRIDRLERDGYRKVKEYHYLDPATGKPRHTVERWEHPEKPKEFVQRAGSRYSVKGVETLLYRLPEWKDAGYVCLCEGEKDADTVKDVLGLNATTNPSGAGNWETHYNQWLRGKDLVIFVDNDDAGRRRLAFLLWELKDVAGPKLKAVTFEDMPEGSDITDCLNAQGKDATMARIMAAPLIDRAAVVKPTEDLPTVTAAKEANRFEFRNYFEFKESDDKGKEKVSLRPRQINDLIKELRTRLLGFPHRVGEQLFDHDRDSAGVTWLNSNADLFSWVARKTGRPVGWKEGVGMVTKEEFMSGLRQTALGYSGISTMPNFPPRKDVFYAHPPLPPPSPDREHLAHFMSFFSPADETNAILLRTFFAAPLFFIPHIPRPAWIIDSESGSGAGKTTLVEVCATLYGGVALIVSPADILTRFDEIMKRLMSAAGRSAKVFLLDNVEGNFSCSAYASLCTASHLSGRAPYGRGEENRPNDLLYVITANSATVDNDIANRSFPVFLRHQEYSDAWKLSLNEFIASHRYHILADMLSYVTTNQKFEGIKPSTRYPEFETRILQAFCGDVGEYSEVIKAIVQARSAANADEETAAGINDRLRHNLLNLGLAPDLSTYFIHAVALDRWFKDMNTRGGRLDVKQQIRNFAKHGFLPDVDPKIQIYPSNGPAKRRGIMWGRGRSAPIVIGIRQDQTVGVMA